MSICVCTVHGEVERVSVSMYVRICEYVCVGVCTVRDEVARVSVSTFLPGCVCECV